MEAATNSECKVSIIVPCYNSVKYIKFCVDSIINQTYENIEVILVDDCSTDNTRQILREYAKVDERVKVVCHEINKGLSISRADGFLASSGEWVFYVDHDDALNPQAIELLVGAIDDETDIIGGGACTFSNDCFEQYIWKTTVHPDIVILNKEDIMENLHGLNPLWAKLYRRTLIEKVNPFQYQDVMPHTFFEDSVLPQMLYLESRKCKSVNNWIYHSREIPNSTSRRCTKQQLPYCVDQLKAYEISLGMFQSDRSVFRGIENQLLQAIKVWYMVNKYDKSKVDNLKLAEDTFSKWFPQYRRMLKKEKDNSKGAARWVIYFWAFNKRLCNAVICNFWFSGKTNYKLRRIKE